MKLEIIPSIVFFIPKTYEYGLFFTSVQFEFDVTPQRAGFVFQSLISRYTERHKFIKNIIASI